MNESFHRLHVVADALLLQQAALMFAGFFYQKLKEGQHGTIRFRHHHFRMPLHQNDRQFPVLCCFYDAIGRPCGNAQIFTKFFDRLMMAGVDGERGSE